MLLLSPGGRRYGYHKDAHSFNRFPTFNLSLPVTPASADIEPSCGPVKDQGSLGACTAFAGTGMREFLARKYENTQPIFSPLFLYYMERKNDGDLDQGDTGSVGSTSVEVMNQIGVCLESADGYDISKYQVPPTADQIAEAAKYKAGAYHRISDLQSMKNCLASGYGFVTGFTVYESFESNWSTPGYMPIPGLKEQVLGGHEVFFIGYDDSKGAFKVRNSWGPSWGLGGNFWFSYDAVADQRLISDMWMQHLGSAWK